MTTKQDKIKNRKLYWSLRITLSVLGIIALYQIVPYLTSLLKSLVVLVGYVPDSSPEFKLIIVCISIYLTLQIMTVITNIIFKLLSLLEEKIDDNKTR